MLVCTVGDGAVTTSREILGVQINEITGEIIRSALRVHSALGPGLLESAYRAFLYHGDGIKRIAN